jgi:hypothetical protein
MRVFELGLKDNTHGGPGVTVEGVEWSNGEVALARIENRILTPLRYKDLATMLHFWDYPSIEWLVPMYAEAFRWVPEQRGGFIQGTREKQT